MTSAAQLALSVQLQDEATLENYYFVEELNPLRACLDQQSAPGGERSLYIYGPAGCGKSHLLQAACQRLVAGSSLYLPLREMRSLPATEVLAAAEQLQLLSLDDVDAICGNTQWEEALFHFFNRALETGCRVLLSASSVPRKLPVQLEDLRSRLSGSVIFQLPLPEDQQRLAILQLRARQRGLQISDEVGNYILSRASRSLGDLMEMLERLDRDSLVRQRSLSIPFVKSCMGW